MDEPPDTERLVEGRPLPQAKDGGVFAGIAMLIREVGTLVGAAGGVVVVIIGVGAVVTIATTSMGTVPDGEKATVAAAAFSVLGTVVGAYFGLRVGAQGKQEAEERREVATAKVERLTAELSPEQAKRVMSEPGFGVVPDQSPRTPGP